MKSFICSIPADTKIVSCGFKGVKYGITQYGRLKGRFGMVWSIFLMEHRWNMEYRRC